MPHYTNCAIQYHNILSSKQCKRYLFLKTNYGSYAINEKSFGTSISMWEVRQGRIWNWIYWGGVGAINGEWVQKKNSSKMSIKSSNTWMGPFSKQYEDSQAIQQKYMTEMGPYSGGGGGTWQKWGHIVEGGGSVKLSQKHFLNVGHESYTKIECQDG